MGIRFSRARRNSAKLGVSVCPQYNMSTDFDKRCRRSRSCGGGLDRACNSRLRGTMVNIVLSTGKQSKKKKKTHADVLPELVASLQHVGISFGCKLVPSR